MPQTGRDLFQFGLSRWIQPLSRLGNFVDCHYRSSGVSATLLIQEPELSLQKGVLG